MSNLGGSLFAGSFAAIILIGCTVEAADQRVPTVEDGKIAPRAMNGVVDSTNEHANVGAMVVRSNGTYRAICSGTLISDRVFVTASHCTSYLAQTGQSDVWVSFDVAFVAGTSPIHHGVAHSRPLYGANGGGSDSHDIAVIVLDAAPGIAPAQLPARGAFDSVAHDAPFVAVGYGVYARTVGRGPPNFSFDATRRVATSTHNATNGTWLRLSQNAATGNGGTCYGDSGGPNFAGDTDVIGGLTITGDTACRATNVIYRLDTDSARSFLGQFVQLP